MSRLFGIFLFVLMEAMVVFSHISVTFSVFRCEFNIKKKKKSCLDDFVFNAILSLKDSKYTSLISWIRSLTIR